MVHKKNRLHIIFLATMKNKIALVWFSKPKPRATSHLLEKKKKRERGKGRRFRREALNG